MEVKELTNVEEAEQALSRRIETLGAFSGLSEEWEDNPTETDQILMDLIGSPYEYGLSLEVESVSPRWGTTTYAWVLSTGGPHDEFDITIGEHENDFKDIKFVFLPWFDRIELSLTYDQQKIVEYFVSRFLYLEPKEVSA